MKTENNKISWKFKITTKWNVTRKVKIITTWNNKNNNNNKD